MLGEDGVSAGSDVDVLLVVIGVVSLVPSCNGGNAVVAGCAAAPIGLDPIDVVRPLGVLNLRDDVGEGDVIEEERTEEERRSGNGLDRGAREW